jgi:hypothetical protein
VPETHEGSSFTAATVSRRSNYESRCENMAELYVPFIRQISSNMLLSFSIPLNP